jgi:hypothetical protein
MAKKARSRDNLKQRRLKEAKRQGDRAGTHGMQPHEIAERTNMKRQQKKMHKQDSA